MKKIYYEKIGRRYVPVSEYDSEYLDSFPKGSHLVVCDPGGSSRHYNIDPALAPLIAAGKVAEKKVCNAVYEAASMHRMKHEGTILTLEQEKAWRKFEKVMGERGKYIQFNSTYDIAKAGIQALEDEAAKLMVHPAVKDAYNQFLTVCKITSQKT